MREWTQTIESISCTAFLLAAVMLCSGPAAAQNGPWALERLLQPDYQSRDLKTMNTALGLDQAQTEQLATLHAAYLEEARQSADAIRQSVGGGGAAAAPPSAGAMEQYRQQMQEALDEMRQQQQALPPGADPAELHREFRERIDALREQYMPKPGAAGQRQAMTDQIIDQTEQWMLANAQRRAAFESEVQGLLRDDQRDRWPALDRQLTRQRWLNRGRLAGESIDLARILQRLELSEEEQAALAPTLTEYHIALHEAMVAREEQMIRSFRERSRAEQQQDQDALIRTEERRLRMHAGVQAVNTRYIEVLAAQLPPDKVERFRVDHGLLAYQQLFRPTRADRTIRAAASLQSLSAGQIASIEALEDSYHKQNMQLTLDLIPLIRDSEAEQILKRMRAKSGDRNARAQSLRSADDPATVAMTARRDLADQFVGQLEAILTPEQFAALPSYQAPRRPASPNTGRPTRARGSSVIEQFDTDGDGRLNEEERQKAREQLRGGGGG